MPRLTLHPNGYTTARTGHKGNLAPPKRGEVAGWSAASARRNDLFLRSIDFEAVGKRRLYGYACTLTLQSAPETEVEYRRLRKRFLQRLTRAGAVLYHHVTEMQPRLHSPDGPAPHMHMAVFFAGDYEPQISDPTGFFWACRDDGISYAWRLDFANYGPSFDAQRVYPITDLAGWARYLAKHGSRSAHHYQRDKDLMPLGWRKTGRMWGYGGDWPRTEQVFALSDAAQYAFRRFANRAMIAEAKRDIVRLEDRRRGALNARQREEGDRLLIAAISRLSFLSRRLHRTEERIGRIVPISDWGSVDAVRRWINACCAPLEACNAETGEVSTIWHLPSELPPGSLRRAATPGLYALRP